MESLEVRSLTFPYRASGPPDGRGVLLLHGFPQFSLEWTGVLDALGGAGYRAIAPDQRGYAPGNAPPEVDAYRADELVADVLAMMDALGWEQADVVGHDWGGSVAWHVAGRHPERVRTLTVVSTPHPLAFARAMTTGGPQLEMSQYMFAFRQEGAAEDALLADDAAQLRALFAGVPDAERYVDHFRDRRLLTGGLNWYRAMRRRDGEATGAVSVPTLYVWGEGDPALSREAAEASAEYVTGPYRFVVLEGAGHWIPDVRAAELSALLLAHLGEHEGAGRSAGG